MKLITNLIFIKDIEDKGGELCGISKRKELLVYLLKAQRIQLPTGTVFNEAFVPGTQKKHRYSIEIIKIAFIDVMRIHNRDETGTNDARRESPRRRCRFERVCMIKQMKGKAISLIHSHDDRPDPIARQESLTLIELFSSPLWIICQADGYV